VQVKVDADTARKARAQAERQELAERAVQEKHEGGWSEQEAQARERLERTQRVMQETLARENKMSEQELQERRDEERAIRAAQAKRQADLAQQAKIPMDQAIQIALRETPGTVVEARLVGERGDPTYFVSILQPNSTGSETSYVLVNAVDGSTIVKGREGKQER
jgi:uncharacterized membrane protein YkoI